METKKAQVIMLPTEDRTSILINTYANTETHDNCFMFGHNFEILTELTVEALELRGYKFQHLYLVTDDEIKEGDWYIDDSNQVRQSFTNDKDYWDRRKESGYKKIVATTDNLKSDNWVGMYKEDESYLPQIPQSFIKHYVKAGDIDEVMVEKDGNNELAISSVKTTWTREEIRKIAIFFKAVGGNEKDNSWTSIHNEQFNQVLNNL